MNITILVENTTQDADFSSEHGLSIYIEVRGFKILFDAGKSDLFAENAYKLGIDLSKVDFAVLSHGHYDHGGGLRRFMQINENAPVYVNRNAFQPHYNGSGKNIGVDLDGLDPCRICYVDDFLEIAEGISLYSCNDRKPVAEVDSFGQTVGDGDQRLPDAYHHEQYLVINENGRRICFSGCSHKGILNIVHWLEPDVLIGGFHFMKVPVTGEGKRLLLHAAQALVRSGATYFTGHCTGEDQFRIMKSVMNNKLIKISCGFSIVVL